MIFLKKILEKIVDRHDVDFEIKPPDLIIKNKSNVNVIRFLIVDEADFGLNTSSSEEIKRFVETYSSIVEKLPEGSEIKVIKQSIDLNKYISRLSNEILNLKATIDVVEEPHVKQRALVKLRVLESIYEYILRGNSVMRLNMIIKIRGSGRTVSEAISSVSTISSIVKNLLLNELKLRVRDASSRDINRILKYEIGLKQEINVKNIVLDTHRVSSLLPIPVSKKPDISDNGLLIGLDIESNWPVVIPYSVLNKHVLVIGPTGRGKTTLLASIIENIVVDSGIKVMAIDFKSDLIKYIGKGLVEIATPQDYPLNIVYKPDFIESIEWSLIVSDILSNVLKIDQSYLVKILVKIVNRKNNSVENSDLLIDKDLSILSPAIELLTSRPNYNGLKKIINENVVFDLSGHGSAFQNTYCGLLLYLYKKIVFENNNVNRLIVIDEAWRIGSLRILLELVKEGRGRNIGVVMSTQNPSDLPREIIENTHLLIIFGSPNEDYRESIRRILGLPHSLVSKLSYLNIGEAVLLNALDPHPVLIRIKPPQGFQNINLNRD
ncbi:MAG: helicase HerA-like domain-containing protein [Desulfurococcaceae archaeon]